MPAVESAVYTSWWTGANDIPPDWNPPTGPAPGYRQFVCGSVGCSGHGFKLAPTMSESLAQMILDLEPRIPIDDYSVSRLAKE